MKLYTRAGDRGFTLLPGPDGSGELRVRKDDPRMAALGALDELNAAVGLCRAEAERTGNRPIKRALASIQDGLFRAGAVLAAAGVGGAPPVRLTPQSVKRLERIVDDIQKALPALEHFVRPAGCELSARLHQARAIARRAERAVVTAVGPGRRGRGSDRAMAVAIQYLNRLSDALFALARQANHDAGREDDTWTP